MTDEKSMEARVAVLENTDKHIGKSLTKIEKELERSNNNQMTALEYIRKQNERLLIITATLESQAKDIGGLKDDVDKNTAETQEVKETVSAFSNQFRGFVWSVRGLWIAGGGAGIYQLLKVYF